MPPLKASQVRFSEITFQPVAVCRGITREGETPDEPEVVQECQWAYRPGMFGFRGQETKKHARVHTQMHPGHEVLVERITRAVYWTDAPEEPADDQPK